MLTAAECQALADEYRSRARQPEISKECAAMLTNIARSFAGLGTQLDRLSAYMRDDSNRRPRQSTSVFSNRT